MGGFLQWLDHWAQMIVPGTVLTAVGIWMKRSNSDEHSKTTDALRELTGEVGNLRGTMETYIEEHAKVHERLPY